MKNTNWITLIMGLFLEKQFEAITEFHMGRPEKLNDLIAFIEQVKIDFPKS